MNIFALPRQDVFYFHGNRVLEVKYFLEHNLITACLNLTNFIYFLKEILIPLLREGREGKNRKVQSFMKRLNKNHGALLTFLYHPKVPADNNASERAIRNAKVKMKVSNQLKTLAGAERFAVLRSVIDTTVKNSQNVLDALCLLSKISVTC